MLFMGSTKRVETVSSPTWLCSSYSITARPKNSREGRNSRAFSSLHNITMPMSIDNKLSGFASTAAFWFMQLNSVWDHMRDPTSQRDHRRWKRRTVRGGQVGRTGKLPESTTAFYSGPQDPTQWRQGLMKQARWSYLLCAF